MKESMIQGVSDVFLPVSDLDRSIEWYSTMLGLNLRFKDDENKSAGMNTGNDIGLCLVQVKNHKPLAFPENDFLTEITFNFRTSEIDRLHETLKANGVETTDIYDSLDSTFRCFTFEDCDGNKLNAVSA
ncbi:MAG TPA: VOC family protein [Bacillales bacterium]|nr:VOC family protein [Bacillales bacterium]